MPITFGPSGAPSQETRNFDALFTTSLSKYIPTLIDNVGISNAFFTKVKNSGGYMPVDGGTDVKIPLMYALGQMQWFEGYDTLNTDPMDGITNSIWQWREAAIPITISRREMRFNGQQLVNLVDAKIQQAEMGIMESLGKCLLQGNAVNGGNVFDPQTDPITGALSFDPIAHLIQEDPTTAGSVGNIAQDTESWWRNHAQSSTGTTYEAIFAEIQDMYMRCARGTGGPPDLILCDEDTYQLFERILYTRTGSRHPAGTTLDFPFENIKWKRATVVSDELVPDVENNTATVSSTTGGTMYFLNTKFVKIYYDSQTNFIQTDWMSAPNQPNAKTKHILWMGGTALSNRRKHGVLSGIQTNVTS